MLVRAIFARVSSGPAGGKLEMPTSQPAREARILRCPHCGATLDAQPFALTARCEYCGHTVEVGRPSPPTPHPAPAPAVRSGPRAPVMAMIAISVGLTLAGSLVSYLGTRHTVVARSSPVLPAPVEVPPQVSAQKA